MINRNLIVVLLTVISLLVVSSLYYRHSLIRSEAKVVSLNTKIGQLNAKIEEISTEIDKCNREITSISDETELALATAKKEAEKSEAKARKYQNYANTLLVSTGRTGNECTDSKALFEEYLKNIRVEK